MEGWRVIVRNTGARAIMPRSTAAVRLGVYSSPVPCEERQRLERVYIDSVRRNAKAGAHVLNTKSDEWREATKETCAECDIALEDLERHRKEHGC